MKILCTLLNASELINGVKFFAHKLGMISEEIADEIGNEFIKIEGYVKALPSKADAAAVASPEGAAKPKDAAAAVPAATPATPAETPAAK
jgi:hypothetical protein